MNLAALNTELTTDPLGRGYSGMTDSQIMTSLRTVNRDQDKTNITGSELLNAVDATEWSTRTDAQKQIVWDIVHLGDINPFGVESTLITSAFAGAGGATLAALVAARVTQISRATELGLGKVGVGAIIESRK